MIKIGDKFSTNQGYEVEVVQYINCYEIEIKFTEPVVHTRWCRSGDLRKGKVSNFMEKTYFDVGYIGDGEYKISGSDKKQCGASWVHMLERCYDTRRKPVQYQSYEGCYTNEIWHNFQNYAEFYYTDKYRQEDWHLDKDIIVPNNREYGPEFCAFVPQEINNLILTSKKSRGEYLIGVSKVSERVNKSKPYYARVRDGERVISSYFSTEYDAFMFYKEMKEKVIAARIAEYDGKLDPRVLESLSNWRISEYE
jgi:hypothetical protein